MIKTTLSIKDKIIICLLAICLLFSCFCSFSPIIVSAETITSVSTPVLEDLQKDSNFNINKYPAVENNHSIELIQIAETTDNELLVYLYIPCADTKKLEPTTISISDIIVDNDNPSSNLYNLVYQNSNGVFYKYKVENLQVKESATRRYNISELHRKFDSTIDNSSDNGNVISEVACPVAQNWTAYTDENGKVYYKCSTTDVVTITDKYVGFVRYLSGNIAVGSGKDSYFIAFSCDYNIDKLVSADVYFQSQDYICTYLMGNAGTGSPQYKEIKDEVATLNAGIKQNWTDFGSIWHQPTYSWNEIQSAEEFLSSVDLNNAYECGLLNISTETKIKEESKSKISNKQWVLNFASRDYLKNYPLTMEKRTLISNVSILRLEFEVDSTIYNLGVVDNKQTPVKEPDIVTKTEVKITLPTWLRTVIRALICIVVFGVVALIIWFIVVIIKKIIDAIHS